MEQLELILKDNTLEISLPWTMESQMSEEVEISFLQDFKDKIIERIKEEHCEELLNKIIYNSKYIGKYPFVITYLNTDDTNIIDLLNKDNIGWFITTGSIDDYIKNIIKTDPVTNYIVDYLTDNIRKHKAYGIPAILRYHNREVIIP